MMMEEINEIIEDIYDAYEMYASTNRGEGYIEARLFDEDDVYDGDEDAIVQDMITKMAIGEKLMGHKTVTEYAVKAIQNSFSNFDKFIELCEKEITDDELKQLTRRIEVVAQSFIR